MTSQSSTNKQNALSFWSLLREDARHKLWMIALSILGSFLAGPVAFLFTFSRSMYYQHGYMQVRKDGVYNRLGEWIMSLEEYRETLIGSCAEYLLNTHFVLTLIIAYVGAIIVAFFGFSYLFNKRKVDLYHSAPISRRKLFTVIWLDGFLIWFVPAIISELAVFVLAAIFTKGLGLGIVFANILEVTCRLTLCFLIVYHVCLVPVMISGNVINAILNGFTYGLLAAVTILAFILLMNMSYDTFYLPDHLIYANPIYVLSPLYTPIFLAIQWVEPSMSESVLPWHLFGGVVMMLLNLLFAYTLYVKRPSELSERGLEIKPIRILFQSAISFLGGLAFMAFFHETAGSREYGWMLFGIVFGSALTFCVLNVVYHSSFKELFSHKLHYGLVLVACVILSFGMLFDITGFDKRLPNESAIKGLSVYANSFSALHYGNRPYINGSFYNGYNASLPDARYVSHDKESIYRLLEACVRTESDMSRRFGLIYTLKVKVTTGLGSYYRTYHLPLTDLALLAPFVESKEYTDVYYPVESLKCGMPSSIRVSNSLIRSEPMISESTRIEALMQAIHQDFEAHKTIRDLLRSSRKVTLTLVYSAGSNQENHVAIDIPYWYENTLALIEEWFPNNHFDPAWETISLFNLRGSITVQDKTDPHELLYEYYGYDKNGNRLSRPMQRQLEAEYAETTEETPETLLDWNFVIDDVTFLKELEPYLIWGRYNDPLTYEYYLLGEAELADYGRASCYVKYGELPLSVLQRIEENLQLHKVDAVDYPEYYDYYID